MTADSGKGHKPAVDSNSKTEQSDVLQGSGKGEKRKSSKRTTTDFLQNAGKSPEENKQKSNKSRSKDGRRRNRKSSVEITQDFEDEDAEPISEDKLKKLEELSLDALVKKVITPVQLKEMQSLEEMSVKDGPTVNQATSPQVDQIEILSDKEVDEDNKRLESKAETTAPSSLYKSSVQQPDQTEVTKECPDVTSKTPPNDDPQKKPLDDQPPRENSKGAAEQLSSPLMQTAATGVASLPSTLGKPPSNRKSKKSKKDRSSTASNTGRTRIQKLASDQAVRRNSLKPPSARSTVSSHSIASTSDHVESVHYPDRSLLQQSCYHGFVDSAYVERTLIKDGDFLVCLMAKNDEDVEHIYAAVRQTDVIAMRVLLNNKKYCIGVGEKDKSFDQIANLIHYYYANKEPLPTTKDVFLKTFVMVPPWLISHKCVNLGKEVARGAYGAVHQAVLKSTVSGETPVAVKILKDSKTIKPKKNEELLTEAHTMLQLQHENIVKIIGMASQHPPLMIILEYMPRGSLKSHLQKYGKQIAFPRRLKFCVDSAAGLQHIEKLQWVHRDVAARNCLISSDGHVKISDFGLTMERKALKNYRPKSLTLPIKWLAPEILKDQLFSSKSDVWAYGIMIYEIFNDGKDPYPGVPNSEIRKRLVDGSGFRMKLSDTIPRAICDVAYACWNEKPANRPSFEIILRDLQFIGKFIVDKQF